MNNPHGDEQQQERFAAAGGCAGAGLEELPLHVWGHILGRLDPKDLCAFGCAAPVTARLAHSRKAGVLLARYWGRVHLRLVQHGMLARSAWVSRTCSLKQLDSREACQAGILKALQSSPDPLPDLAAAVQKGIALIASQASLHGALGAPIRADLVRCANWVCLLAWRQHRNERRRRAAAGAHQALPAGGAAAGVGAAHPVAAVAPQAAAAAGAQQVQPPQQAAAVQTELGPSLQELEELLSGLGALMAAPGNPSMRLTGPSLNLLHYLVQQQLLGWNLPAVAGAQQGAAAAAAGVADAAGGGGDAGGQPGLADDVAVQGGVEPDEGEEQPGL